MAEANYAIKEFLRARMYRHWKVNRMTNKARRLTEALFTPAARRPGHAAGRLARPGRRGAPARGGEVCDYIAGMTDRFAIDEYKRLTDLGVSG